MKNKRVLIVLTILLVTVLVFSLTACSLFEKSSQTTEATEENSQTTPSTEGTPQTTSNTVEAKDDIFRFKLLDNDTYEVSARYVDMPARVVIPSTYNGKSVTRIADNGFYHDEDDMRCSTDEYVIPEGIIEIGEFAFGNCISTTSITIPSTVKTIGEYAFHNCTDLKQISIPAGITYIGVAAFGYCYSLEYNEYNNAFYLGNDTNPYTVLIKAKDASITQCTINNATKVIYSYAFYGCTFLSSISIPNGVTQIGYSAFYQCSGLTTMSIPDSVSVIDDGAFEYCSNLTTVSIPDSVTRLGSYAFDECNSLNYTQQNNACYLGNSQNPYLVLVKAKNTSITSCTINQKTKFIAGKAFSNCSSLTSITIPNGVLGIGNSAFAYCSGLTTISIPNSVTELEYAFYRCTSLTSVTIGSGIKRLKSYTFEDCTSLSSITYNGTIAEWKIVSRRTGDGWDNRTGNYTVHCTDGNVGKSLN